MILLDLVGGGCILILGMGSVHFLHVDDTLLSVQWQT